MAKGNGAAPATPRKTRSTKKGPTTEEIQVRAYELYLERRGAPGNPLEDWVQAEREVGARYGEKTTKTARAPRTSKPKAA